MTRQVEFIGRDEEIAAIRALIEASGTSCQVVCIYGKGGVGKTRLLQEIRARYAQSVRCRLSEVLDFDDPCLLNPDNTNRRIASTLAPDVFAPFFQGEIDYHKMQAADVSPERLRQEMERVNQQFVTCFNTVARDHRVVLFFDTTDRFQKETGIWKYLEQTLSQFQNVSLLMAGRNAKLVGESLQNTPGVTVTIIKLTPLSSQESRVYLQKKQEQTYLLLEPELAEKLLILSEGRPILLDLAVEWRGRGITLNWLLKSSANNLHSVSREHRQEFEQHLVGHIQNMRSPLDQLFLVLSYIYPMNIEMLRVFFQDHDAQTLFQEAAEYVFVKTLPNEYLTLHDEMRRMIDKYVWPQVDPDGGRRSWYSQLMRDYLSDKIPALAREIDELKTRSQHPEAKQTAPEDALKKSLEEEELTLQWWMLRVQHVRHTLATNLDEGLPLFETVFQEATNASRFYIRTQIFEQLQRYTSHLSPEQRYILQIYQVRLFFDEGQYGAAKELCENMLTESALSPIQHIDTLLKRANANVRLGKVQDGLTDFKEAVSLSEKHKLLIWRVKTTNALGWANRLLGDVEEARAKYQEAQHLYWRASETEQEQLQNIYGWILNNLAFVLSERNDTRRTAINIATLAIQHWRAIKNNIGLGGGYLVLGIVYYRSDIAGLGLEAFQSALDIFQPLKTGDWLGQIYSWRGALYQDLNKLTQAKKDLETALQIGSSNIKAMSLNRLGRVYMSLNQLDQAEHYLRESYDCARELPDYKYWLSSLGRLATIAAIKGEPHRLKEFEEMLQDFFAQDAVPEKNALGVTYLGFAQIVLEQNDPAQIEQAVHYLKQGIGLVIEFGSYARTDILSRLTLFENHFNRANPELIQKTGRALLQHIQAKEIYDINYATVLPIMNRWANWKGADDAAKF